MPLSSSDLSLSRAIRRDPTWGRDGAISGTDIQVDDAAVRQMIFRAEVAMQGFNLAAFLRVTAVAHFQNDAVERFALEGDSASGMWEPLRDATRDIRAALGYGPSGPINERTGELLEYVVENEGEVDFGGGWATLEWPTIPDEDVLLKKYTTAQEGSDDNPLGYGPTPARPVVAADMGDMAELLLRLSTYFTLYMISGGYRVA